jgi:hypothetical protein
MNPKPVRLLATWLCLVTCLLGGLVPQQGYVVCVGMNGHVGASPTEGDCSGCEGEASHADPGSCPDEPSFGPGSSCCPCLDIQLLSNTNVSQPETSRVTSFERHVSANLTAYLPRIERPTQVFRVAQPVPPHLSSFDVTQLRSVILVV